MAEGSIPNLTRKAHIVGDFLLLVRKIVITLVLLRRLAGVWSLIWLFLHWLYDILFNVLRRAFRLNSIACRCIYHHLTLGLWVTVHLFAVAGIACFLRCFQSYSFNSRLRVHLGQKWICRQVLVFVNGLISRLCWILIRCVRWLQLSQ